MDPLLARTMRRCIAEKTRVPESHVFVSCTHTHSGPLTNRFRGFSDMTPAEEAEELQQLATEKPPR